MQSSGDWIAKDQAEKEGTVESLVPWTVVGGAGVVSGARVISGAETKII